MTGRQGTGNRASHLKGSWDSSLYSNLVDIGQEKQLDLNSKILDGWTALRHVHLRPSANMRTMLQTHQRQRKYVLNPQFNSRCPKSKSNIYDDSLRPSMTVDDRHIVNDFPTKNGRSVVPGIPRGKRN